MGHDRWSDSIERQFCDAFVGQRLVNYAAWDNLLASARVAGDELSDTSSYGSLPALESVSSEDGVFFGMQHYHFVLWHLFHGDFYDLAPLRHGHVVTYLSPHVSQGLTLQERGVEVAGCSHELCQMEEVD